MNGTVTARLVAFLLLALVAVTGAYDLVRLRTQRAQLMARVEAEVRLLAETLGAAARPLVARGRVEEVQALVNRMVTFPEISRVTVYNADRKVVATALDTRAPAGETEGGCSPAPPGQGKP
jgi:uncharacterized membrane protein affecting hemolysin expression